MCTRVAAYVVSKLEEKKHHVTVLDPAVLKLPMLEKPHHHYRPGETPPENLVKLNAVIAAADGFILVSAEYNHTIPPALTNTMNHFGQGVYAGKPSGLVTYSMGPWGGQHAAIALRAFTAELGCLSTSNIFGIPSVMKTVSEDGRADPTVDNNWARFITGFEWHAQAMRAHRQLVGPCST